MVKHILKKFLRSRDGETRIRPNLEERRPNGKRIRLDVLFQDFVDIWREPVPYLGLLLHRPMLRGLRGVGRL